MSKAVLLLGLVVAVSGRCQAQTAYTMPCYARYCEVSWYTNVGQDRLISSTSTVGAIVITDNTSTVGAIVITDNSGQLAVSVGQDGSVMYGPGFKADTAAREFWEQLGKSFMLWCADHPERKQP